MVFFFFSNIQCGLLHCAGGNKVPFYGPDKDSSKTTVFSNGQEYECKYVISFSY